MLKIRDDIDLKDVEKIQNLLNKDIKKDTKKLTKICKKFIETQDLCLMPDFEYYGNKIYEEGQHLNLIDMIVEKVGE